MPYLEDFIKLKLSPSDTITTSKELFVEYYAFLSMRSSDPQAQKVGKSYQRFAYQFKTLATTRGWTYVDRSGLRGYNVHVCTNKTRLSSRTAVIKKRVEDKIHAFLQSDQRHYVRIQICNQKGYGAVAKYNIEQDTILAEYCGQIVNKDVALKREEVYNKTAAMCTMFQLSTSVFLDGNKDSHGEDFKQGQNQGAIFNHSKSEPNCKTITCDIKGTTRLFVMTKMPVPAGAELVYDYGDKRRGLPQFIYK